MGWSPYRRQRGHEGPSLHECLDALNTKIILREIDARQRGASSERWSERLCALWTELVVAQIELHTGERDESGHRRERQGG